MKYQGFVDFHCDEHGQDTIEYSLLLVLIALTIIVFLTFGGLSVTTIVNRLRFLPEPGK